MNIYYLFSYLLLGHSVDNFIIYIRSII